jgi:hypothetical protein
MPAPPDPDVTGRVPVHQGRGRLEPERLLDRGRQQARVGGDERQLGGMAQQVQDRVADHALGGLDPAEHEHRRVGDSLPRGHLVACTTAPGSGRIGQ